MPLLNPGIVVNSAYLSDDIWISQREETINSKGRSSITKLNSRRSYAIPTAAGANDLKRVPEGQDAPRVMCFIVNDQVRGPSPNCQPDLITWPADGPEAADYLVVAVDPYPSYGIGWYQVVACSQDIIDAPL